MAPDGEHALAPAVRPVKAAVHLHRPGAIADAAVRATACVRPSVCRKTPFGSSIQTANCARGAAGVNEISTTRCADAGDASPNRARGRATLHKQSGAWPRARMTDLDPSHKASAGECSLRRALAAAEQKLSDDAAKRALRSARRAAPCASSSHRCAAPGPDGWPIPRSGSPQVHFVAAMDVIHRVDHRDVGVEPKFALATQRPSWLMSIVRGLRCSDPMPKRRPVLAS